MMAYPHMQAGMGHLLTVANDESMRQFCIRMHEALYFQGMKWSQFKCVFDENNLRWLPDRQVAVLILPSEVPYQHRMDGMFEWVWRERSLLLAPFPSALPCDR